MPAAASYLSCLLGIVFSCFIYPCAVLFPTALERLGCVIHTKDVRGKREFTSMQFSLPFCLSQLLELNSMHIHSALPFSFLYSYSKNVLKTPDARTPQEPGVWQAPGSGSA